MNVVILSGRLTRDPEQRFTQKGTAVCNFNLAVDKPFDRDSADFINCIAWGKTAEFICKYFTKGDGIELRGRIQTRTWDDSSGKRHYVTEVVAEQVEFPKGKSKKSNDNSNDNFGDAYEPDDFDLDDDDLPF